MKRILPVSKPSTGRLPFSRSTSRTPRVSRQHFKLPYHRQESQYQTRSVSILAAHFEDASPWPSRSTYVSYDRRLIQLESNLLGQGRQLQTSSKQRRKRHVRTTPFSEITRANSTAAVTTSLESKWQTMTNGLLELSVGSFEKKQWNEAIRILTYWFGNRDDPQVSLERCWEILDRLYAELEHTKGKKRKQAIVSAVEVLNPILLLWKDDFLEHHRKNSRASSYRRSSKAPMLPSEVADQLRNYQLRNLVVMDSATHAILLDAAGKYSAILSRRSFSGERVSEETQKMQNERGGNFHKLHHEGVLFADKYLKKWIEDYKRIYETNDSTSLEKNGVLPPRPDTVAFGTLIHAWVESGLREAPKMAEAWVKILDELDENYPPTANESKWKNETSIGADESRKQLYSNVLQAWARDGNPVKAKEWIDRMIREEEYPDIAAFNRLLMAYQSAASKPHANNNQNNFAERAEDVLRHMQRLYHEPDGFLSDPPNIVSYNIVSDVWTKRAGMDSHSFRSRKGKEKRLDAARRAHGWFEQMKNTGIKPNTVTYNTVITAYSRAGYPQESEKLLQEMIALYQKSQDGNANDTSSTSRNKYENSDPDAFDKFETMTTKPDVQSFTSVLAGWARVGSPEAAERAEELLRVMQLPEIDIQPNVETFGSCIHCWARAVGGKKSSRDHREHAVRRAEALFHEMKEEHNILPDVYAYTGLLNVYGRSGRSRKAHEFLEICLDEYNETRDPRMKPTVVTFTAILNAWSKATNAPEASERAHGLLHRMKDEYGIEPNVFSYSSVLDAYSRSNHPDAASKALSLFREMREVRKLEPNAYTCSNVLKAMARGGKVEDAENLLFELVHDKSIRAKLTPHAFSSVLYGWSKSKKKDAPERAEKLVMNMQELYHQNMIDGPPNSICWNNVLACWAHSDLPGAAQRADDLLRRIEEQQQELHESGQTNVLNGKTQSRGKRNTSSIECNLIMYNTVMNAWANNGNFDKANDLYHELLEQHALDASRSPPDDWTYRALWKAIIKTNEMGAKEKLRRMQEVMRSMTDAGLNPNKNLKADLERFISKEKSPL